MARGIFALVLFFVFPTLAAHVAVLETVSAANIITLEEKQYLTDVLRSEAVKALPAEQNFIVEIGRNISADYVAQAHVGQFANNLTITVELYETAGNRLLGSFSSKAPNVESLETEVRQKSRDLFMQITTSTFGTVNLQPSLPYKGGLEKDLVIKIDGKSDKDGRKYARGSWKLTPGVHEVEFLHRCYEPQKFNVNVLSGKTITLNGSMNVAMGKVSLRTLFNENFREVPVFVNDSLVGRTDYSGRIPICSKIEVGEDGAREKVELDWKGKDKVKIIHVLRVDSLIAAKQIAAEDASRAASTTEKSFSITKPISIAMMALGVAGVAIGIYENSVGNDERKKYDEATFKNKRDFDKQWDKVESARTKRNVFYGVGFGMLGAGAVMFFVF